MKYIAQITYQVTDKECPIYDLQIEYEDYDLITLDKGFYSQETAHEDFVNGMQEYIGNLLDKNSLEYGATYRTVMMIELTYTKDYYGEVDCDSEEELLFHGVDEEEYVKQEEKWFQFEVKP